MFGLLLTLLIIDSLLLIVVVLLQAGKGGGLAAMGGGAATDSFMGGRQAANLLTRATWVTGAIFLVLSLILSILSTAPRGTPESILRQEIQQTIPAGGEPQPILPGIQQQGTGEGSEAGGAGNEPAPND